MYTHSLHQSSAISTITCPSLLLTGVTPVLDLYEEFAHISPVFAQCSRLYRWLLQSWQPQCERSALSTVQSTLASWSADHTFSTNSCRDSGRPSLSLNNGPSSWPLKARYARIAAPGQISFLVLPVHISSPILVWSIFEPFM